MYFLSPFKQLIKFHQHIQTLYIVLLLQPIVVEGLVPFNEYIVTVIPGLTGAFFDTATFVNNGTPVTATTEGTSLFHLYLL